MRTETISIKHLKNYKLCMYSLYIIASLFLVALSIYFSLQGSYFRLFHLPIWGIVLVNLYKRLFHLESVSFDDGNIYFERSGYEVQVPFSEIKNIELIFITGIYKVSFKYPVQGKKQVYMKPSIWYPLNFNTVDNKVDELKRRVIRFQKQKAVPYQHQIPSKSI